MTEERSCGTCRYYNADRCERYGGCCFHHSKWQPIQKAPSFQITEEEAREKLDRIIPWGLIESQNEEAFLSAFIGNLKDAGLIRKSALVELVEEAEKMYCDYRNISADDFEKKYDGASVVAILDRYHDALQALKKDHPEFGGKK